MSSTDTLYFLFLTTGFTVGFGHCIGMCGPIVVSFSLQLRGQGMVLPHLLYHAGRIVTYAVLGGIMGLAGSFTMVAARIAVIQKAALIGSGLIILVMGLAMRGWIPLGGLFPDRETPVGPFAKGLSRLSLRRSPTAYFPMGLLLGFLPCGPVYTALLASARTGMEAGSSLGGLLSGMGLMVCFGLGTVPALFLIAKSADLGWLRSREKIYAVGSILMVAAGVYFIIRGIRY